MDADGFWALVDSSRTAASKRRGSTVERHVTTVTKALKKLPDAEVADFARHLRAAQRRALRWDLWAAGYLALGGMSDDAFLDFRTWLVSQGREAYDRVLADPDALVELSWDEDQEDFDHAEEWGYVPGEVLEGRDADLDEQDDGGGEDAQPAGDPFPEDDPAWFAEHLPRLHAKHGSPS